MTTWRDRLQAASFRNVPFSVKSAERQVGRRTVRHEYPQRDDPDSEDLGRLTRSFHIEALIVGSDYFAARDKLIDALEKAGPGELVHPFYGRMSVVLDGPVRISESFDEGGLARFSLDFVRAADTQQVSETADTRLRMTSAAEAASAASGADFAARYSIDDQPAFLTASALAVAQSAVSEIQSQLRGVIPDLTVAAAWLSTAQGISSNLATAIASPVVFVDNVQALISGAQALADNPLSAIRSLATLFDFSGNSAVSFDATAGALGAATTSASASAAAALSTTGTSARVQQATNTDAMVSLVQRTAVIAACNAVAETDFETLDDALATRDALIEQLDALTAVADDELVYSTLTALRVALVTDIAARGTKLSRLSTYTLRATMPALVVAYMLYADATRDSEIIARNPSIRHPGFVPGGTALQVLIDS